jgi:hypothetical protein
MQDEPITATNRALRTPRAAAVAGIVFSVLLSISLVLIRSTVPPRPIKSGNVGLDPSNLNNILIAVNLVPFAGIAFLWFIGVVRDRIGRREDRFFATVFLGSGLLFVAMLFVSTAMAAGLLITFQSATSTSANVEIWRLGRNVTNTLVITYAMRMAGVFIISTATIALRTQFMPRWLAALGYIVAIVLLLSSGLLPYVELLFPIWVFLVSVYTLLVVWAIVEFVNAAWLASVTYGTFNGYLWLWAILDLVLAAAIIYAGIDILRGGTFGRVFGVIIACISAVRWFFYIPAEPWLAIVVIVVDVLIIYGLVANGEFFDTASSLR